MRTGLTNEQLLTGDIKDGLLKLAIPLMFLNLINAFYSVVDTYFIGQMGELQVGALTLVSPIMNCGVAFASGLSAAGVALISRSIGQGNRDKACDIATHLIGLCVFLGIAIGLISFTFADPILHWLETPADIYHDTLAYFLGISFDYLFLFLLTMFQCIRQSNGDTKTGVKLNALAAILNIILDPIFIFGLDLGTLGAALATTLSKVLVSPIILYLLINDHSNITISFKRYRFKLDLMKKIVKIAIPASLGQFLSSFGFVIMSKSIVAYGSIAMSAYGIGNNICNIFYIPVNGIGAALSTFIGQNLGNNNPERAKLCFHKASQLMTIIAAIVTVIGLFSAKFLINVFIRDISPALMALALEYSYYSIATAYFMGWFQDLSGVFDGSGNTSITMILSTVRLWGLRIPMIYLFGKYTSFGPTGIWWSMIISNFIICITGQILYYVYPWTKKGATI